MAISARVSRYYGLDGVVDRDPRQPGRTVVVDAARVAPAPTGTFQHVLAEGDRLDQLAFRYYGEPRKWWLICDANPDFLSPLDLLGRGPIATVTLTLVPAGPQPPDWPKLASSLDGVHGVTSFRFLGDPGSVELAYNRFVLDDEALRKAIAAVGLAPSRREPIGRVGKPVTIPPDTVR
jgi:hypothetical protein